MKYGTEARLGLSYLNRRPIPVPSFLTPTPPLLDHLPPTPHPGPPVQRPMNQRLCLWGWSCGVWARRVDSANGGCDLACGLQGFEGWPRK